VRYDDPKDVARELKKGLDADDVITIRHYCDCPTCTKNGTKHISRVIILNVDGGQIVYPSIGVDVGSPLMPVSYGELYFLIDDILYDQEERELEVLVIERGAGKEVFEDYTNVLKEAIAFEARVVSATDPANPDTSKLHEVGCRSEHEMMATNIIDNVQQFQTPFSGIYTLLMLLQNEPIEVRAITLSIYISQLTARYAEELAMKGLAQHLSKIGVRAEFVTSSSSTEK